MADKDPYELAVLAQEFAIEALLGLVADLTDPSPCRYDHHGTCQTHMASGYQECPHERARRLLAKRADAEGAIA